MAIGERHGGLEHALPAQRRACLGGWFGSAHDGCSVCPTCGILQCTTRSSYSVRTLRRRRSCSLAISQRAPVDGAPSTARTAILGWILFVVLAVVVGGRIGHNDLDESAAGSGESKRGDMIVEAAGFPERAREQVLVQGKGTVRAGDPEVTAAVRDVVSRLERIDGVTEIESPLDPAPAPTPSPRTAARSS